MPTFLIIGAMKSGTTTLFEDLRQNPLVYFPPNKEPGHLRRPSVLEDLGRAAYARLYAKALPDQARGDASTVYSKLPDHPGVAQRAAELLGDHLKVIYVVRHPLKRAVSQFQHELPDGRLGTDLDAALMSDGPLLHYSQYARQIGPWLEHFGRERILIVHFERYIRERRATVREVCEFLGVPPHSAPIDDVSVYNKGAERRFSSGWTRKLIRSQLYQQSLRQWLPKSARRSARSILLRRSPILEREPSPRASLHFLKAVRPDLESFKQIMGLSELFWQIDDEIGLLEAAQASDAASASAE